ncbi:MAG TPA: hypothetical protein VGF75_05435 [Candidatus Saccharimonadales bacterium]
MLQPEPEIQPKRKLKKRYLIIPTILVLIIIAVIYFVQILTKPVTASVSVSQKTVSSSLIYNIDLTPVLQSGQYASFDYPKGVRLYSSSLNDQANSLESYSYYVKDTYSWTLAIDVTLSTTGLDGLSAYQIRTDNPEYSAADQTINGQPVVIFTDNTFTTGFEKVAFFSRGNEVATVSLIGNDSSGLKPLITTFNMVLNSWIWH